jgi:hypothetical protein
VRAGDSAMYWFDPLSVPLTVLDWNTTLAVTVSGRLAPVDLGDGKIHMKLTIARSLKTEPGLLIRFGPAASGSSTYDLTAAPGEVLSFELPTTRLEEHLSHSTQAVRFRARILTVIPTTTTTTAPITLNQR